MGLASLLFVALLTAGLDDKPIKVDPTLLFGVWEQVRSEGKVPAGSTTEFTANGQYHFRPKANNISEYHSTYVLQGNQLTVESMNPGLVPGQEAKIVELTNTKLVIDYGGDEREYRRRSANGTGGARPGTRATNSRANPGVVTRGEAPNQWRVVTVPEDGYRVELPGPPRVDNEPTTPGQSLRSRSYLAPNAEYFVIAHQGLAPPPREKLDDGLRMMLQMLGGLFSSNRKIQAERPARLGTLDGREYDVSLDTDNGASGVALCRMASREGTLYLLAVLPTKAGPIPREDATRFLDSFSLIDIVKTNRGATRPNPARPRGGASNPRRTSESKPAEPGPAIVWGNEVDPDGDVRIRPEGATLSLSIPPTAHLLAPERDKMNAPRVVIPVGGDFTITVRVDGRFDPSDKSTVQGLSPRQSGGLIVWKDEKNYLVFQRRTSAGDEGRDRNQVVLEELVGGAKGVTHRQAATVGPLFLRIERLGNRIKAESSPDGRRWVDVKPVVAAWLDGQVEVGVVAVNTSTMPHSVTFDNYKLLPR